MGGHIASIGEGKDPFKILTGKAMGKRHLGRPRHKWKHNIKIDLNEKNEYEKLD